ncbi:hypothetical protein [Nocardioides sp. TF02-7]|uniref:hypothetical protein n=1 Tax=Nocardioides sp. TF02-7 TaxID=2917724 RepID=UPI001F05563B|nr:hypothetical protein [Nocardioides sp. TF02-7]UMG92427.1 hypothetical protein MF408_21625 [Nocardioides sp. TF02-7]
MEAVEEGDGGVGVGGEHLEGLQPGLFQAQLVSVGLGGGVGEEGVGEVVDVLLAADRGAVGQLGGDPAGGRFAGVFHDLPGADLGEPHPGALGVLDQLGVVQVGVGLDDLGLRDPQQPARGLVAGVGDGLIDQPDVVLGEFAGKAGDLAGQPALDLQRLHRGPQQREAVAQVEAVRGVVLRGHHAGRAGDGELGEAQLRDRRRTFPAELEQPVSTPGHRHRTGEGLRVGGVQVAPVQHPLHRADLHRTGQADVVLHTGQRGRRVEGGDVLFEHVFIQTQPTDTTRG